MIGFRDLKHVFGKNMLYVYNYQQIMYKIVFYKKTVE